MTFTLEMLPAREGDCLLLSWLDNDAARMRHILIDGGRAATYADARERLAELPDKELELLVVTHVDRDHIEGALKLIGDDDCPVAIKEVWFNGFGHLDVEDDQESFGGVMGEALTEPLLADPKRFGWNKSFGGGPVRLRSDGSLVTKELPGGLKLTLLSPTRAKLKKLIRVWENECKKAGIIPVEEPPEPLPDEEPLGAIDVEALADDPFEEDAAEANGSSIALLAEYDGKRVLLGADAHPGVLIEALDRLQDGRRVKLRLDAFKVSHHGSRANLSRELLERLDCDRYLISTSGSYFQHPSPEAVARILVFGGGKKELLFNYKTKFTKPWDEATLRRDHGYAVTYGVEGSVQIAL